MDDRTNTIAGWVLGAGIVALGATIVTGEVFKGGRPEKMGYPIEGVEDATAAGAEAEKPIAFYLASADPAKGADVFKKCASCHTIDPGAANGIGPNLHGAMGAPLGRVPGYAYSASLKEKGGQWDWEAMNAWLKKPKGYIEGTKMAFAGLSAPEDRANILAYLNSKTASPLPVPAAPAEATDAAAGEDNSLNKPGTGVGNGPQKGENEPIITEQQAAKAPAGNIGGEGAPKINGAADQEQPRP